MTADAPAGADLVIRGGTVVDGGGGPRFAADVAVTGDRIVAVGGLDATVGETELDASGRIVAPGFIDVHTHDDRALMSDPAMAAKVSQGVTTVVVGNCGISLAPLSLGARTPPPPFDLLGEAADFRFADMAGYLEALEASPAATNAACLVGHSTLRLDTMTDLDRPATDREIAAMEARLREALEAGAVGMSTGLFYDPARAAPTDEVVALAEVVAAHGGLYATHMRDEGDAVMDSIEETLEIGRRAGLPVVISHHKVMGRANFGRTRETLACIAEAAAGQEVGLDVYPYVAGSTVLRADLAAGAERTLITWSKARPDLAGTELSEAAQALGCAVAQAVERLQPAGAIYFMMDEADLRRVLAHPDAMIGSDGLPHDSHPHPRLWGTFPRVLGHYCREEGLFPLEEAVRRMTGVPAKRFGLAGRGAVTPGGYADLVIFDAGRVIDRATYAHPRRPAAGIEAVFVNGAPVWRNGAATGQRPGRALKRPASAGAGQSAR